MQPKGFSARSDRSGRADSIAPPETRPCRADSIAPPEMRQIDLAVVPLANRLAIDGHTHNCPD
jgi:hypothetical protein